MINVIIIKYARVISRGSLMTQCGAKFSVLMSVYKNDDSACLKEALQSVFSQTLPPAQVVLGADGPLNEPLEQVIAPLKML